MSKLSVSLQSPCKGCAPRCGHWPVVTGLPAAAWSPWWLQCEEFREMVRGVETRGGEQPGSSCGDWAGWEMLGNATKCISAKTDIRPRTESCLHIITGTASCITANQQLDEGRTQVCKLICASLTFTNSSASNIYQASWET